MFGLLEVMAVFVLGGLFGIMVCIAVLEMTSADRKRREK